MDYEHEDRIATRRAAVAIDSKVWPLSVLEACASMEWDVPVSEDDLIRFYQVCETWGVRIVRNDETSRRILLDKEK